MGLGQGLWRKEAPIWRAVVLDYGVKRNILRCWQVTAPTSPCCPRNALPDDVLALEPHGVLLSNGPGDPAATGEYAIPTIKAWWMRASPCSASASAIRCWGLALGAKTARWRKAITAPIIR